MTGQPAYTDADVQAAVDVLVSVNNDTPFWAARLEAVLDAVAPAIAARALREAADRLGRHRHEFKHYADPRAAVRTVEHELHAIADEIEAGR